MLKEISVVYEKRAGTLVPTEDRFSVLYQSLVKGLEEGQKVEVYITVIEGKTRTLGQLAKINAMVRTLAEHTGQTPDEVKNMVKLKAGLYRVTGSASHEVDVLSFGDCSKEQMSLAIQTCMELGVMVGADL